MVKLTLSGKSGLMRPKAMAVLEGRLPRPVANWRQSEKNTRSIVPRDMRHSPELITVEPSAAKRIFLVSRPLSLTKLVISTGTSSAEDAGSSGLARREFDDIACGGEDSDVVEIGFDALALGRLKKA